MKNHSIYTICLLAMLSFAACQKADVNEPKSGPDTIQALLPETKTSFSDEGIFSWETGDALSVPIALPSLSSPLPIPGRKDARTPRCWAAAAARDTPSATWAA